MWNLVSVCLETVLVSVRLEIVEGLPRGTRDSNMALLMPRLEEAVDVILAIAPLEVVIHFN